MDQEIAEALMESQYRAGFKAGSNAAYRRYIEGDESAPVELPYCGHLKPIIAKREGAKVENLDGGGI